MTAQQSIQDLLAKAFRRLKVQNELISLRALAARMELSPSYLSKIMTGRTAVPLHLIPTLKKGFHLDVMETGDLQRLVLENLEERAATPLTGLKAIGDSRRGDRAYRHFTKNDFLLLEKWFFIPLLNLVTVSGADHQPEWFSRKLGVPVREISAALATLQSAGYLRFENGRYEVTDLKARFPTDKSHERICRFHQMMMEKAKEVLRQKTELKDFHERLVNGISFAGSSKKIQEAQAILNKALYDVAELMSAEDPDHVFQINLQFFKVTSEDQK